MSSITKDFYSKVFKEINEINDLGSVNLFNGEKVKVLNHPNEVVSKENPLAIQKTSLGFGTRSEEDRQHIVDYFTALGNHLADNQDGVYIDIETDHVGMNSIKITFPRVG